MITPEYQNIELKFLGTGKTFHGGYMNAPIINNNQKHIQIVTLLTTFDIHEAFFCRFE